MEGRKRRSGGGCSPHDESASSSDCSSSRGTTTAARSPALLSRPPAQAGPPRPLLHRPRCRPPMAPPSPEIDGHCNQSEWPRYAEAEEAVGPLATPVRPARPRPAQPSPAPRPLGRGAAVAAHLRGLRGLQPAGCWVQQGPPVMICPGRARPSRLTTPHAALVPQCPAPGGYRRPAPAFGALEGSGCGRGREQGMRGEGLGLPPPEAVPEVLGNGD